MKWRVVVARTETVAYICISYGACHEPSARPAEFAR